MHISLLLVTATTVLSEAPALADDTNDGWNFRLAPYLWLPTIDGSVKYSLPPGSGGSPELSVGPTDWLELLNAGLLVSGSATKGRFGIYSDLVYLSLASDNDGRVLSVDDTISVPGTRIAIPVSADLSLNTQSGLGGLLLSLAGGYQVSATERSATVLFAGLSYQYGWGDLLIAYRHLACDQDSNSLLQDFSFSGPGLGARFTFD